MEHEAQPVETSEHPMEQSLPEVRSREALSAATPLAPSSTLMLALACLAAFLFPGLGHLVLKRWGRGALLALSIGGMFLLGLFWLDGHLYRPDLSGPLSVFTVLTHLAPFLANVGVGGLYGLCYLLDVGFQTHPAASTYEIGNTFLLVAGLLNYLVILDASDIARGRKR